MKRKLALLDTDTRRLPMRWRPVVELTCRANDACVADVMSGWRGRSAVKARHAVWHAIHQQFRSPLAEIGRRFGFHHTSVMHGIEIHELRLTEQDGQKY